MDSLYFSRMTVIVEGEQLKVLVADQVKIENAADEKSSRKEAESAEAGVKATAAAAAAANGKRAMNKSKAGGTVARTTLFKAAFDKRNGAECTEIAAVEAHEAQGAKGKRADSKRQTLNI